MSDSVTGQTAEVIVLGAGIVEVSKKLAKPIDQITLCHQDEYGKTHIELTVNHLELPCDFPSLLLHHFGRVADQTFYRDSKQQSIDRAVWPVLL